MKSLTTKTSLVAIAIALSAFLMISCNNKITQIPVITSISLSNDTVMAGSAAELRVAVKNVAIDNLVFYYSVNGGKVEGEGDTVAWLAPSIPGVYEAHVLVADNEGNQATDSILMVVVKNDTLTKLTGIAACSSDSLLNLQDSKVRLYTSKDNMTNHVVYRSITSTGFGSQVSYVLENIPAGTYYLDIWKDTDFGNTMNVGDYYGWYGNGNIHTPNPQPFVIEPGIVKNIAVQMWIVPAK